MAVKRDLRDWIMQALSDLGGQGSVVDVCRHVWEHHEAELRASGDLFFTWQYDVRWAAQSLRDEGLLWPSNRGRGPWALC